MVPASLPAAAYRPRWHVHLCWAALLWAPAHAPARPPTLAHARVCCSGTAHVLAVTAPRVRWVTDVGCTTLVPPHACVQPGGKDGGQYGLLIRPVFGDLKLVEAHDNEPSEIAFSGEATPVHHSNNFNVRCCIPCPCPCHAAHRRVCVCVCAWLACLRVCQACLLACAAV